MLDRRNLLKLIGLAPAISAFPALAALPERAPEPDIAPVVPEIAAKDGEVMVLKWDPVEGATSYRVILAVGFSMNKLEYRTQDCRLSVPAKYGDRFHVKIAAVYPGGTRGGTIPNWSLQ